MSNYQKFIAGFVGKKDSMREKAHRLMKKELSAKVKDYPASSRAMSAEKVRPFKNGGRVKSKGLADVSGLQGRKSGGNRFYKGGRVANEDDEYDDRDVSPLSSSAHRRNLEERKREIKKIKEDMAKYKAERSKGYAHGGRMKKKRCYAMGGDVEEGYVPGGPSIPRGAEEMGISPFEQEQVNAYNAIQGRSGAKPPQGKPLIRYVPGTEPGRTRQHPDEPMEGEALQEAAPQAPRGGGALGYNAMPRNDRRMGYGDRARLGAEQVGRMAEHYLGRAGRQVRGGLESAYNSARRFAPQIGNAVRGAARSYAPQIERSASRLHPGLGRAVGSVRRALGFKKGGPVNMKQCSRGGNVYEREMMGERHGKKEGFAKGGVGKIRHKQADKMGKQIKGKHFGPKRGR